MTSEAIKLLLGVIIGVMLGFLLSNWIELEIAKTHRTPMQPNLGTFQRP